MPCFVGWRTGRRRLTGRRISRQRPRMYDLLHVINGGLGGSSGYRLHAPIMPDQPLQGRQNTYRDTVHNPTAANRPLGGSSTSPNKRWYYGISMSRRARVPAPFQRLLPSVIRIMGPRLIIAAAGCALLVFLGGGTYLLAHLGQAPAAAPRPAAFHAKPADTEVLGASTTVSNTTTPDTPTNANTNTSVKTDTNAGLNSSSKAVPPNSAASNCITACSLASTAPPAPPSFDIAVDTSAIQRTPAGLYVPFSVTRHNGLSTPIIPAKVSITAGGSLTNLITVQSKTMVDADHGALTLLTVGLFPHDITVHLLAHSGGATADTTFSYRIGL
jgi:hypothetical protein